MVVCVAEGGEIRLRNRVIETTTEGVRPGRFAAGKPNLRRLTAGRAHWLVEVEGNLSAAQEALTLRGATAVSYLPPRALVVAAPENMNWDALPVLWRGLVEPEDKISPRLSDLAAAGAGASTAGVGGEDHTPAAGAAPSVAKPLVLVRFHRDVEAWEAQGILEAEGLAGLTHPALERVDHLFELELSGLSDAALRLALWDEVEYIFAAPEDFRGDNGSLWYACEGMHWGLEEDHAQSLLGSKDGHLRVSMLAAPVGEGWDGPGLGSASLTYSFGPMPPGVEALQARQEAVRALAEWSRAAAVSFRETTTRQAARNLDIFFATGEHGDPFPFLAGTRTLAHAFYPAPPNPEPLAGDIHVNTAFAWSIGGTWDIFSVLLHEAGHSLGLGHSDVPGAVMYPYYQSAQGLHADDVESIRRIYAAAGSGPSPQPPANPAPAPNPLSLQITAPAADLTTTATSLNFSGSLANAPAGTTVAYWNEANGARGQCLLNSVRTTWSCAAVQLAAGANRVAIEAKSGATTSPPVLAHRIVTRQADADVVLQVNNAPASTAAATLTLSGSARHASGIASVRWTAADGRTGVATLAVPNAVNTNWNATVPLLLGRNEIVLRALARSGDSASQAVRLERTSQAASPPAPPTEDKEAPRMTVQTPIGTFIFTSASRMTFRGTATDNVGVTRVTWRNAAGAQSGDAALQQGNGQVQWSFDVNLQTGFNAIEIRALDAAGNASAYTATVRRY
jgi:hypothetical protein